MERPRLPFFAPASLASQVLATVVYCLGDALRAVVERDDFVNVIATHGKSISVDALQTALEKHALPDIRKELGMKTTSMSIAVAKDEGEGGGGLADVGDEVLKQVLSRMDAVAKVNEDLENGLRAEAGADGRYAGKVKRLARKKAKPMGPPPGEDDKKEKAAAAPKSPPKSTLKGGPGGKENQAEGGEEGGGEEEGGKKEKKKKTDEEKAAKKAKKLEKARKADFETDVAEAMQQVIGRVWTREEMDAMGPMDRRKYEEKSDELRGVLGGLRGKRAEGGDDKELGKWDEEGAERYKARLDLKGGEEGAG
jgi:hypothetical protein